MIIGIPKETFPGEHRVAMVPDVAAQLIKLGLEVIIENGAGTEAGFGDSQYIAKGVQTGSRDELFAKAEIIAQVRAAGANMDAGKSDLTRMRKGQTIIGLADPLSEPEGVKLLAGQGVTLFALELVPRITRAQAMDVLSSMATIAGYKAVLLAAGELPRMFPMLITAAGTIKPAKLFVIGAGVAGLQAIASGRRLGAVVKGYDVRPAVKEQVESLGAKFVEMELDTGKAEGSGGYAKAMDEEFYRKQRELMGRVVADSDVVISTAAVPGKKAPLLITAEMVRGMSAGSVVIDLAAATGGNCELTRSDERVVENGVTILGPTNLPSTVPYHASLMFAKNVYAFVKNMVDKSGNLKIDESDEIIRESRVLKDGEVVNNRVQDLLKA